MELALGVVGVVEPILHLIKKVKETKDAVKYHEQQIEQYCGHLFRTEAAMQLIRDIPELAKAKPVEDCIQAIRSSADAVGHLLYAIAYPRRFPDKLASAGRKMGNLFGAEYPKVEGAKDMDIALSKLKAEPKKTDFWHKFAHGVSESQGLKDCMEQLDLAKTDLALMVSFAHVGITVAGNGRVSADRRAIEAADDEVRKKLGNEYGLRVAKLIRDKTTSDTGDVEIPRDEYQELQAETKVVKRRILNNTTSGKALMFNASIGEKDLGASIDQLSIEENHASDYSTMVNYPQKTDTFDKLLLNRPMPVNYQTLALAGMVVVAFVTIALAYLMSPR